jgi:ATP-dependent Lon protease
MVRRKDSSADNVAVAETPADSLPAIGENVISPEDGKTVSPAEGDPSEASKEVKDSLPIIPLRDTVLFPFTMTSLTIRDAKSITLIEEVSTSNRLVALFPCLAPEEPTTREGFFEFGCVGRVVKMLHFPDETLRVLIRGLKRVRLDSLDETEPYFVGTVTEVQVSEEIDLETEAVARNAVAQFQEIISLSPNLPDELRIALLNMDDYGRLSDLIADTINLSFAEKRELLKAHDLHERLALITTFLNRESQVLRLGNEIQDKVNTVFATQQREHILREQLRAIQEQLGEEPDQPDMAELRQRLAQTQLPEGPREACERELKRLSRMHPSSGDYNVARTYIEWLLDMPWDKFSADRLDLTKARRVLDRDHFKLDKVKERILEHLAVMQLNPDNRGSILCFVGPPGVGKTSLGRSIAHAMGREFVRISLGGVRDEAEIRGHRRTYVGAMPGRIIQGIKRVGTANPVFMLDEIDKLGNDFRGDPASALLEVLDPQQNTAFSDHYLDVDFDLSKVFFITTANLSDPIPPALQDRMEIIRLPGYTHEEKREIAKRFLVPRQLKASGVQKKQLSIRATALDTIIGQYTAEAGVRNLEREMGNLCRKVARKLVGGEIDPESRLVVTEKNLIELIGPPKRFPELVTTQAEIGVTTGLAWTAVGGEILQIEVARTPGQGKLVLTGSLGDVMKESAQIAFSFIKSQFESLKFDPADMERFDYHIHVPAGATPKDGPSAGVTIATALASLVTGRAVYPLRAMTGELSLRGHILPVGGVKEKVLAAARANVRMVLLPKPNLIDLQDVPEEVKTKLEFVGLEDARSALDLMLK